MNMNMNMKISGGANKGTVGVYVDELQDQEVIKDDREPC